MAMSVKFPSVNQLITLAIALAVLFFVVKMLPANVQGFFRV